MLAGNDSIPKTNVTLKMLIDAGLLMPGSELVCDNPGVRAVLNEDGSIAVNFNGNEKVFGFLSGAARYIEKKSLNGWLYWSVVIDGRRENLGGFRDQYIKNNV